MALLYIGNHIRYLDILAVSSSEKASTLLRGRVDFTTGYGILYCHISLVFHSAFPRVHFTNVKNSRKNPLLIYFLTWTLFPWHTSVSSPLACHGVKCSCTRDHS